MQLHLFLRPTILFICIASCIHSTAAQVNYATCSEKYGNLTYIPESNMFDKYPPHLLSFPGSGNSFVRLLIEYATGFYTGSMGMDDFEYLGDGGFVGERSCGLRLSALRAHPHFFDFLNGKLRFAHNNQRDKCKRGLVREMKKIIMLVRNPYDALWSYYQLLTSLTHKDYLTTESFEPSNWLYLAPIMAAYWDSEYYRVVKPTFETFLPEDIMTIKYEDLTQPDKREAALKNLLKFMQYNTVSDEQLSCAFLLADKPFVHRNPNDPHRVTAKTAFLVSAESSGATLDAPNSHKPAPTTPNKPIHAHGTQQAVVDVTHNAASTHHRNLLCQMREPFAGMAKFFNYSQFPVSMETTATSTLCNIVALPGQVAKSGV